MSRPCRPPGWPRAISCKVSFARAVGARVQACPHLRLFRRSHMSVEARESIRVGAAVALLLAVGLATATRAAAPVPQKGGNKTVYAIAIDADNKLVTDLRKDEWAIREDGTDRAVVDLKPAAD